jgi:hypothetical protein
MLLVLVTAMVPASNSPLKEGWQSPLATDGVSHTPKVAQKQQRTLLIFSGTFKSSLNFYSARIDKSLISTLFCNTIFF